MSDNSYLLGECQWARSRMDADELGKLKQKVERVPHSQWQVAPRYALFSADAFTPRLVELAREQQVLLVGPEELFRGLR